MVGELPAAARTLNAFYLVWRDWGFLPEEYVGHHDPADLTTPPRR